MNEKVLLVDDDPNLRASCERIYRRQFQIETADGGENGLACLAEHGPFAVVVADRQMPRMDGIEFLAKVRQQAPDTIRIMLTGNADLEGAIRVVNEGNIFRFLTKPCRPEIFLKAIQDAQEQYRLVTGEKELLEKTLSGSIRLLTDMLSMMEPKSFGRTKTLRDEITTMASRLRMGNVWEMHLAVMLAPIGQLTVPPETLIKSRAGRSLLGTETQMLARMPEVASRLLANIPRLEGVAQIVLYQSKHFDGSGYPQDEVSGESIPLGARLLKVLLDLMELNAQGLSRAQALAKMREREGWYDPAVISAMLGEDRSEAVEVILESPVISVKCSELIPGMVLRSDVKTESGIPIFSAGHEVNEMTLEKLRNFAAVGGIKEPILVERGRV